MLAFKDAFNNEDPLSKPEELQALYNIGSALPLVLGNLVGLWSTWIAARLGCYFLSASIFWSVVVSAYLYHLCQTTHECFQFQLFNTVRLDHFTATAMLGIYMLNKVNVRTVCQILHTRIVLKIWPCVATPSLLPPNYCPTDCPRDYITLFSSPPVYHHAILDCDRCACGHALDRHFTHDLIGENGIYDAWSAISNFTIIVITVIAVEAHPFSYAAFIIVIASVIMMWFIKIFVIDEGEPTNFYGRISWPELAVALILSFIGLAAYVIDSYAEYRLLHSIWHVAIYAALGFNMIGTMKSVNGWKPIITRTCCK